jgi:MSHA biogenesis protein MshG
MPQYAWFGRDAASAPKTGVIEAGSASAAAEALVAMSLVPVVIEPHVPRETAGELIARLLGRDRVDDAALTMFSRQMHTLLRSGVPILRALAGLNSSTDHPGLALLLKKLRSGLDAGHELSQVMARYPKVFDTFYVAMVRVGEQTGQLAEIFLTLFRHLEFQAFMREQVKAALRYPKFVIAAMAIALVVLNVFVIPQFARVFASYKAELPLMTRVLLGSSHAMVTYYPLLIAALALGWAATRATLANPGGRLAWDRWKLKLPVAGKVLHKAALARACGSLAMVHRSGVPLIQGISLAADVVDNRHVEERIKGMRAQIERGDSVLAAASRAGIFTPLVLQMVMVGEESGTLDEMLSEIATMYQREVELELKTMGQQIEPILIFVLGGMVLVLALGIFMPMWELGSVAMK